MSNIMTQNSHKSLALGDHTLQAELPRLMLNRRALLSIKTLHILISLVESAAILYVLYCGLTRTYKMAG
jgi:hypothetical protein